jgi:flagellar capping protein FliD
LVTFKKSFSQEIESKVKEQTGKMQDQIDSFAIENENLKERLRDKDKKMDSRSLCLTKQFTALSRSVLVQVA